MVLNKRERTTAIVVGSALALIALYYLAIDPFITYRAKLVADKETLHKAQLSYDDTLRRSKIAQTEWDELMAGALKENSDEAGLLAAQAVGNLAAESRVQISAIRPESALTDDRLSFVPQTVKFTGTGTFGAVSHLLNQLENPKFPVKVLQVQLSPKEKEGLDNLQVQLTVATVSYNKNAGAAKAPVRNAPTPQ